MFAGLRQALVLSCSECDFWKTGHIASEDVLLHTLLNLKCIPILLHALQVCQLPRLDLQSLDFIVNKFLYEIVSNK